MANENVTDAIKNVEAATSGSGIRSSIVTALNLLNSNTDIGKSYARIPIEKVNSICTR